MSKFYVGQPVICVNGGRNPRAEALFPGLNWPETGAIYRVRAIYAPMRTQISKSKSADLVFILLHGLHNRKISWPNGMVAEAAFYEERFEPITDIDGLRRIAAGVSKYMGSNGPRVDKKVKRVKKKEDA